MPADESRQCRKHGYWGLFFGQKIRYRMQKDVMTRLILS
jgi:hypothetical protein